MLAATGIVSTLGATYVAEKLVDYRGHQQQCRMPLTDIIHDTFPSGAKYEKCIDILVLLLGLIVLLLVVLQKLDYMKVLKIVSICLILRSIMINVTVLPSPICDSQNRTKVNAIGGCHGCIFSGHTSLIILFSYLIYKCYPKMKIFLLIYSILSSFLITITRSHYTIDVLVAWIVAYCIILKYDDI